jgi:hypothetical protein
MQKNNLAIVWFKSKHAYRPDTVSLKRKSFETGNKRQNKKIKQLV